MSWIGAIWGFSGVVTLLGYAIVRLAPRAAEALKMPLEPIHWIFLGVWTLFMLVAEGYRGFQKKFSPRTAARVRYLRDAGRPAHHLFAPFFCMGYFHAKRKTQITAICLTLGIILLVVLVRFLPQPWRGMVDFGVVLGLTWGIVSFAIFTARELFGSGEGNSPEVPDV